jgi:hypothetical protein
MATAATNRWSFALGVASSSSMPPVASGSTDLLAIPSCYR